GCFGGEVAVVVFACQGEGFGGFAEVHRSSPWIVVVCCSSYCRSCSTTARLLSTRSWARLRSWSRCVGSSASDRIFATSCGNFSRSFFAERMLAFQNGSDWHQWMT